MVTTRRRAYHSSPRAHILDEVILGFPLETAYQNVCLASGPMDRTEFEYWYYRFYCGRYNLDHDRNQDRLLTQLPLDVLDKILKLLGISERVITDEFTENENRKEVLDGDYQKCALKEFMAVMRLPGLKLDKLRIKYEQNDVGHYDEFRLTFSRHLQEAFNAHHQQIYLKNVHLDGLTLHSVISILNSLAPKFLEKLEIKNCTEETSGSWEDLVRMEQWKQARCIFIHDNSLKIPIEKCFHVPWFEISVDEFTVDNLVKIRDTLLPSTNFSHCSIRSKRAIDQKILKTVFPNFTKSKSRYAEFEFNNRTYGIDLKVFSIYFFSND